MGVLRYRPLAAATAVLAVTLQTLALVAITSAPAHAAALGLRPGDLVVSDSGHDRLVVHPANGDVDWDVPADVDSPQGLVVTPAGDIVVIDQGNSRIVKIAADGTQSTLASRSGIQYLALDGDHVLYSGSSFGGVGRVSLTGGVRNDTYIYSSSLPVNYAGITVDAAGDVVGADWDDKVVRIHGTGSDFTRTDVPEVSRGSADYSVCSNPRPCNTRGVALTGDDRVIVADTWNDQVWESDGSGGARHYGSGLDDPTAVAVGLDGTVYATDSGTTPGDGRVVAFTPGARDQSDVVAGLAFPSGLAVVPVSPEEVGDTFVGTANGEVVRVRGSETVTIASGLDPISDVVVRDDGDLVAAAGNRLVELSGDGATSSVLASLAHPVQALALEPDGDLLVAIDDGSGGTVVDRVAADGSVSNADASPIFPFTALTVDDLSEAYAAFAVPSGGSIVLRTSTGDQLPGTFPAVSGLVADPAGSFLLVGGGAGVRRVSTDHAAAFLSSGIAGAARLALDMNGDILVAASADDALLSVPAEGGTPTTVAAIDDPVAVGVYVPRPELGAVTDFPGTGNVGAPYDGYDFDATGNDGGTVTFRAIGDLPPGLTLDSATGELEGTPTANGDYSFRVQAANRARGAVSDELEIEIGKITQSIDFGPRPSLPKPDDSYTPTATGGDSGNPVTFSIDPSSSDVCTYDSSTGKVTFLIGDRVCTVLGDQQGDADHEDAATAHQDVYVDKFPQTVSFSSTAPTGAKVGDTYTPAATGPTPTATISFTVPSGFPAECTVDGDGVVHFEHVGHCRVTATVAGDDRHWPGTASQNIAVTAATLEFADDAPTEAEMGTRYLPTTNYTNYPWIDIDASSGAGVCSMDNSTGEIVFEQPGPCVFFLDTFGDPDYAPSRVERTVTVTRTRQTITFSSIPTATAPIGSTYTPVATGGGSGNPVTFSIAPSSAGVCTLASGVVHLDHAGTCVLRADQLGDADHEPAVTATQTIQVAQDPSTVTITSPPVAGVVGQRYAVTATTDPAGSPVDVTVTSPGVCRVAGGDVVLDHVGTCDLRVDWVGDADHGPAHATQSIAVSAAATSTEVDVRGRAIVATVSVLAPGAGAPTGIVEFFDGATSLGTAELADGIGGARTAVLVRERAAVGGRHEVTARYAGVADYAGSERTVAWVDPSITYTVSSPVKPSAAGWYRAPVTVTFQCTAGTAPLVGSCPAPLTFAANRRPGRSVVREVFARDGTTAGVVVTGIRIDLDGPKVRVLGAKSGHTYAAPRNLRCLARDRWSGVDSCVVKTRRKAGGHVVAYRAIALDRAGNRTVVRGTYRVR